MNNRAIDSTARDRRTTVLTAIGTFAAFSLVTLVAWSLTRTPAPAPASSESPVAATAPATFETISIEDFKKARDANELTVIDVRAMDAFVASHIPASMHIPVSRIEGEIPYLPKGKLIVTYCTCPAEESSGEAAMILARFGVPAKALKGGLEAWTSLGYPTESGVR